MNPIVRIWRWFFPRPLEDRIHSIINAEGPLDAIVLMRHAVPLSSIVTEVEWRCSSGGAQITWRTTRGRECISEGNRPLDRERVHKLAKRLNTLLANGQTKLMFAKDAGYYLFGWFSVGDGVKSFGASGLPRGGPLSEFIEDIQADLPETR